MNMNYESLLVDKENEYVQYNDEVHKYWTKDTKQNCISVTTLIHEFTTFDEEFWSAYKTLERMLSEDDFKSIKSELTKIKTMHVINAKKSEFNINETEFEDNRKILLKEWEDKREASCVRGTAIHKEHELEHLAGNTKELQHLGLGGKFATNTNNKIVFGEKGIYPELLLSRISDDGLLRIAGQADLVIVDGEDVYILDYKGLDITTPILTTKGFKMLMDLTKSDIIFDKDGNETNILNISEIHYNPCYKITFDNGEEIIADHEHRWLVSFRQGKDKYKEKVLTTEEIKNAFDLYKEKNNSLYLPKIINPKSLNTKKVDLPIDPYILGYWLGDGTSVAGSITCVNNNVWEEIKRRGYNYGEDISGEDRAELRTIFGLRTKLNELNLLGNKRIPVEYLLSSYEQRLDLLRGFMDSDGYYNPKRKRFVMATTREYQADCLMTLLATLGVKPTKIYAKKYCNNKEFDGWDVCFTMKENPFLVRNQEGIEYPNTDKASFRNIKSIELVETIPTKCLEVDSPSHTFLFGRGLIPTHNTNKSIDKKSFYDSRMKKSAKLKYPLNNLDDCNFMHYTLQLSTYAWMIQQINPNFKIKLLMLIHYDHDGNCNTYECEYIKEDVERMLKYYKKQVSYTEFKKKKEKIIF